MKTTNSPDSIFEEYLRLRELIAAGRRAQSMRLRVSACCYQPVEEFRGWEICALCRRQTQVVELETLYKPVRRYDKWSKVRMRGGQPPANDSQERWTISLLDRWLRVRMLIEPRPRGIHLEDWKSMLYVWARLLRANAAQDVLAHELGITTRRVRYLVEKAREVVNVRAARR